MAQSLMFDPPAGWLYGFPTKVTTISDFVDFTKFIPSAEELTKILIKHNYPVKDIPLALKYSRFWTE